MQNLYLVQMWEKKESDDGSGMGPTDVVVVQLLKLDTKNSGDSSHLVAHVADGYAGSWVYANLELLKMLAFRKEKFVGSLPNLNPLLGPETKSFWIVTEPVGEEAPGAVAREALVVAKEALRFAQEAQSELRLYKSDAAGFSL